MRVNSKTISKRNALIQQTEEKEPSEEVEPVQSNVLNDFAEKIEPATIPTGSNDKRSRPRSLSRKGRKVERLLKNLSKIKNISRKTYKVPEHEEWTSRLRQSGREVVLDRIKILSEQMLTLKSRAKYERHRLFRQRHAEKQNDELPKLTLVKVEGEIQIGSECAEELGFVKMENPDLITGESTYRLSQENEIPKLTFDKVEGGVEDEDVRPSKLKRRKHRKCKHLTETARTKFANETEEQRSVRLEQMRRISKIRYWTNKHLKAVGEKETQNDNKSSLEFNPGNSLDQEILIESPTPDFTVTRGPLTRIEAKFGAVYNLICTKKHSHHPKRLQTFDSLCTSDSWRYILSTVIWHKFNRRNFKENFRLV